LCCHHERVHAARQALVRHLGERHPLSLRALLLSGLIRAQRQQHDQARPLLEVTLAAQRAVLRSRHAHTLRTQYELAIALTMAVTFSGW
jgi:hypothetical protein